MDRFEPGEALRLLEEERCTHVSGNDTMAVLLLNHPDRPNVASWCLRGGWAAAKTNRSCAASCTNSAPAKAVSPPTACPRPRPTSACPAWWEPEDIRISRPHAPAARPRGPHPRHRDRHADVPSGRGRRDPGAWLVRHARLLRQAGGDRRKDAQPRWLARLPATSAGSARMGGWSSSPASKEIIRVGGENVAPRRRGGRAAPPSRRCGRPRWSACPTRGCIEVCARLHHPERGLLRLNSAELLAWAK